MGCGTSPHGRLIRLFIWYTKLLTVHALVNRNFLELRVGGLRGIVSITERRAMLEYQNADDSLHDLVADGGKSPAWHAARPPAAEDAPAPETLAERLADRLRDMIVTEEFAVGSRLRERQLAERLGASRTPLRDALKILAAEELVLLSPGRGATIAPFSPASISEKLDLLSVLEGFAGELAASRASEADIAEIRALHHELLAAYERRDRLTYFRLNQAIHRAIVDAARNGALARCHAQLNRQVYAYRWRGSADASLWSRAIAEHGDIVERLTRRDGAGLSAALRAHVGSTWRQLRAGADAS